LAQQSIGPLYLVAHDLLPDQAWDSSAQKAPGLVSSLAKIIMQILGGFRLDMAIDLRGFAGFAMSWRTLMDEL
jgi:hypothetical protein